jgi:hypothetical protein
MVLRVEEIYADGFTAREIQQLLRRGILHRRHKGIYTYGTDRPPWKGVLLAAQWACGEDAFLTGRTSLALDRICGMYLGRIEVAVPRRTVRARRPPIQLARVSAAPAKLRRDGPLRYVTVPDALLHLATHGATPTQLSGLITEAIHRDRFSHPEMRALLERCAGQPGIQALSAAYASYRPGPKGKSGLERSFGAGLRTRPWIPEPEVNVHVHAAGVNWELDRYWPEQQVAVELQSRYHDAAEDREKDEFKAAKLAILGIQIICFSEIRWDLEPGACLDDLEAVLARRGWRRAA